MKKPFLKLLILVFTMINFMEPVFARHPELSGTEKMKSHKSSMELFNGKNLDGWYVFIKDKGRNNDPKKVFTVQNGLVRISGEEFGCLTSNEEYENYKLEVEFKWGDLTFAPRVNNARDSGVLLNSTGEDGGYSGTWMHSTECQLIEGGTGDLLVVGDGSKKFSITCPVAPEMQEGSYMFQPSGKPVTINGGRINWFGRDPQWKDVKGFRGAKDMEKPLGKWNKLACISKGKEVFIYLNGTLVNHAVNVHPAKGRIQLQSECAEIFFKNIKITQL